MRTTSTKILESKKALYSSCPNCGSMNIYRDLRDKINDCRDCHFVHIVGHHTVQHVLDIIDENARRKE